MTWTGKLEFADFGPGAWVLRTDKGEKIALYGEIPRDLDGARVRVEGKELDGMGIAMVGSASVEVTAIRRAG